MIVIFHQLYSQAEQTETNSVQFLSEKDKRPKTMKSLLLFTFLVAFQTASVSGTKPIRSFLSSTFGGRNQTM
jgi:hypothetical protein